MITLTITNAGLAALANSDNSGVNAVTLTKIAAGAAFWADDRIATFVAGEFARTDFIAGSGGTSGSMEGSGLFTGASRERRARGVGVLARND